jgi:hypothetical protein
MKYDCGLVGLAFVLSTYEEKDPSQLFLNQKLMRNLFEISHSLFLRPKYKN